MGPNGKPASIDWKLAMKTVQEIFCDFHKSGPHEPGNPDFFYHINQDKVPDACRENECKVLLCYEDSAERITCEAILHQYFGPNQYANGRWVARPIQGSWKYEDK